MLCKRFSIRLAALCVITCLCLLGASLVARESSASGSDGGLIYLHGRYIDPLTGRFISPDPVTPAMGNMGLNRYAYVGNDPVNATDPSGYRPVSKHRHLPGVKSCRPGCGAETAYWRQIATTDSLTGLPNEVAYKEAIEKLGNKEVLHGSADGSGFKEGVNDPYGHLAGDDALREMSKRLSKVIGPYGTPYRVHGDEFYIIFKRGVMPEQVELVLAEAQRVVGEPIRLIARKGPMNGKEVEVKLGVDVGWGRTFLEADQNMYDQKIARQEAAGITPRGADRRTGLDRRQPITYADFGPEGLEPELPGGGYKPPGSGVKGIAGALVFSYLGYKFFERNDVFAGQGSGSSVGNFTSVLDPAVAPPQVLNSGEVACGSRIRNGC